MTPDQTYRTDALSARREAREHLKSLRAARIARRRTTGPKSHATTVITPENDDFAMEPDLLFSGSTHQPAKQVRLTQPEANGAPSPPAETPAFFDGMAPKEVETELDASSNEPGISPISGSEEAEDSYTEVVPSEVPMTTQADTLEDDDETTEAASVQTEENVASEGFESHTSLAADTLNTASDLEELPGAGGGMVWMFNQCGVMTLNDLARSNPADLSERLGVVGRILDIGPWIEYAKDRIKSS